MLDIIGRKAIDFSNVRYVVLDEADEMLNMGFQEDINNILSETPNDKKTWLFSATMPKEVRRIAQKYMTAPVELTVGTKIRAMKILNINITRLERVTNTLPLNESLTFLLIFSALFFVERKSKHRR